MSEDLYPPFICPKCKTVLDWKAANSSGCFDGIKNSRDGMIFKCCGAPVDDDDDDTGSWYQTSSPKRLRRWVCDIDGTDDEGGDEPDSAMTTTSPTGDLSLITTSLAHEFWEYDHNTDSANQSHFHTSLINTFVRASEDNRSRLIAAFPVYAVAFQAWNKDRRRFYAVYLDM